LYEGLPPSLNTATGAGRLVDLVDLANATYRW